MPDWTCNPLTLKSYFPPRSLQTRFMISIRLPGRKVCVGLLPCRQAASPSARYSTPCPFWLPNQFKKSPNRK